MKKYLWLLPAIGVLLLLTQSCSDNSTSPQVDEPDPVDLSKPLEKLPGDDNDNILDATFDFSIPSGATEQDVSTIESNGVEQRILRTEIEVSIQSGATVGQINQLIESYDAKIVDMLEGINSLILHIPDPGDMDALNSMIQQIESEKIVEFVIESTLIEDPVITEPSERDPQKIPSHIDSSRLAKIEHHLAIRAHGAWNLSNAIVEPNRRPWFVIADFFGDGPPGKGYNSVFNSSDFSTGDIHYHGYHVLGIALGIYNEVGELDPVQNDVTGIVPEQIYVRALDMQGITIPTLNRVKRRIINLITDIRSENPNANIVLNTSMNSKGSILSNNTHAYNWIGKVRGSSKRENLENKFIHFTSAGNYIRNRYPAKDNSMFALAGLENVTKRNSTREKLVNTFVVENRVRTDSNNNQRSLPGCTNISSIIDGNLSAIGTLVYSFGKCLAKDSNLDCIQYGSDNYTSYLEGTSMATPQAAGVAAYIWAVNPDLSVSEVMDIMRETAEERNTTSTGIYNCNIASPQPVVDAYAAVLAAGGDNARIALLDVNEDGGFNENDIEKYLSEFEAQKGKLDYSRYDLNGTGKTGGPSQDRFDLDHSMSYGTITKTIEGTVVEFNESSLTDTEILCYYAYSDLFEGDESKRSELLNGICTLSVPSVTTAEVNNVTASSAQSGGTVTDDGGATITARGVCWSTSPNPDLNDSCTTNGTGTGEFSSTLTGLSPETEYFVRAYATNEQGTGYGNERSFTTETGSDDSGRDKTTAIVEVTSPTGRIWMDRNLGASRAATSPTDSQAHGDYYQWGRGADGHQKKNSGTTPTRSSTDQPGHGSFILVDNSPFDWRTPQNNTLWQGVNGINNPCPSGYRLPTSAEWNAERQSWSSNDAAGAFASPLKLLLPGDRVYWLGVVYNGGSGGSYWSSTVSGAGTLALGVSRTSAGMYSSVRATGRTVRCIKN